MFSRDQNPLDSEGYNLHINPISPGWGESSGGTRVRRKTPHHMIIIIIFVVQVVVVATVSLKKLRGEETKASAHRRVSISHNPPTSYTVAVVSLVSSVLRLRSDQPAEKCATRIESRYQSGQR